MKLLNFPILKLTFFLIVGILIAHFLIVPLNFALFSSISLLGLLLLSLLISKNQLHKTSWFGLLAFLTMISIGILSVNIHEQRRFKNHYSKVISTEINSSSYITFRIREVLKPTAYHDKFVVTILKVNDMNVTGKLLMNIQKDSLSNPLQVDDILMSSVSFSKLNLPLNPYQFNYNSYLKNQHIDHQFFTENNSLLKISSKPQTMFGYADRIRSKIDQRLKTYHLRADELAMIDALLLGQRKDISQDTYNSYVNAGVIHILAVSGLHIGIILWILNWLFKPIEQLKRGNYIKIVIIAMFLWCFAVIAGLSPSVTRAVTMFTIIAIGINLKRPVNIYNTLAISMFFLLLFKPMFLFEVGFQMSYLAVLSIVSIQPLLKKIWSPKNKIVGYFWSIFTVTMAAQIGVVPISLYYFHQFPGLFFLSNLVIIPILGFILGFGIIVIILALFNTLPQFIADFFRLCISSMNSFVSWISHQEGFVFRDISFGIVFVIVSYVLIISVVSYFKKPKYSKLVFVLIVILLIQTTFLFEKHQTQTNEFVVFQKSKFSILGLKNHDALTIASNFDSITLSKDNIIRNYKVGNSIHSIKTDALQSVYQINNEKLLVVDSLGIYNIKSFKPNYVLLRNSPKINLHRLIDSLQPKQIIADGSNYKSYIKRWKTTCEKQKIPFHITSEKGAYILNY